MAAAASRVATGIITVTLPVRFPGLIKHPCFGLTEHIQACRSGWTVVSLETQHGSDNRRATIISSTV